MLEPNNYVARLVEARLLVERSPNGFATRTLSIYRMPLNMGGVYTATITNECAQAIRQWLSLQALTHDIASVDILVQARKSLSGNVPATGRHEYSAAKAQTSILVHPICNTITIGSVEMNIQERGKRIGISSKM
ncbi:MAG: hypothetical protein U5N85_00205 [Arcicella sp.]|nr:hypothetical protein [Arcicella sp.]